MRAHRIAEVRVEPVGQLHNAGGNLVEVDLLLPTIALDHKHDEGAVDAEQLRMRLPIS